MEKVDWNLVGKQCAWLLCYGSNDNFPSINEETPMKISEEKIGDDNDYSTPLKDCLNATKKSMEGQDIFTYVVCILN